MVLPAGIFVKMPSNEFEGWSNTDLTDLINRLRKRLGELETERAQMRATRVDYETVVLSDPDDDERDSDDIMNDPDVREMVERGEHTCHMFDAECLACVMDEDDSEVRVLTEEEVENDPEMTAHFC